MIDAATLADGADLLDGAGWELAITPGGEVSGPDGLLAAGRDWIAAEVPGTAAAALEAASRFDRAAPRPLHDLDVWYRTRLAPRRPGPHRLVADGLATICEVYVDGRQVLASTSMYARSEVVVDLAGPCDLLLCFRALAPHLKRKGPRARWKTRLVTEPGLRLVRTTFFGHMPGWCPPVHAVGPWRALRLVPESAVAVEDRLMQASLADDGTGHLRIRLRSGPALASAGTRLAIACAGLEAPLQPTGEGLIEARLALPGIAPWWPHSHGDPVLHDVRLFAGDEDFPLGRTGFRRIEVERGTDGDGFALAVNGVPVFCRGAVWTSADIVALPESRAAYAPWLRLARDGGMNMLRIGGTMAPEAPAFFELCDELGLLVWQDLPFANLDYPASDPDFAALVRAETRALLARTAASPSLAVVCGGSEMHQQGAMMGLAEDRWNGPLTAEILPQAAAAIRPDVPFVPNSPSGGALPFFPGAGIAHYYGVGAYRRPLDDARRAQVRFAAECLAFSNVPEPDPDAEPVSAPGHAPDWKRGVPRDRDVGWDFEDVRDHYVRLLFGIDPLDLRQGDPAAYLDHGRAAVAEVMEATFAEWRRPGSSCAGALVWTFQDVMPGAGWGVVDVDRVPKSAFFALKRAFAPLRLSATDEGTNGLALHVVNDTSAPRKVLLVLRCLSAGGVAVAQGEAVIEIGARAGRSLAATDLLGGFFDVTQAYRFGPASHVCVHAVLRDADGGARLDETFQFPLGRARALAPARLSAMLEQDAAGNWWLALAADRLAQSVAIEAPGFLPEDNWFHLAPGEGRRIGLAPRDDARLGSAPRGHVRALNASPVAYSTTSPRA